MTPSREGVICCHGLTRQERIDQLTEDTKPAAPSATDDPEPVAAVTVAEQPAPVEPVGDEAGSSEPEQPEPTFPQRAEEPAVLHRF